MGKTTLLILVALTFLSSGARAAEADPAAYQEVTQAELAGAPENFQDKKVRFTGTFLFTGSDFCYQIRKTKINTKDYFCFALGTPSVVRLYLKKDHPQADELLNVKKGAQVTAFGSFDFLGGDYKFLVVDRIEVKPAP